MTGQIKKHSPLKIVGASIIGLIAGLCQPIMLTISMLFVGGTVIAVTLYAFSGALPALIFLAASAYSLYWMYGLEIMGAGMLLIALPALIIALTMRRGLPYFARLRGAVAAQLFTVLALIVVLYLGFRQNLIDVLISLLKTGIHTLTPSLISMMLEQFAASGILSAESAELVLSGGMSAEEGLNALLEIADTVGKGLKLGLPAVLLSSGLITGILATVIPSKICSRRGDGLPYVPISGWFVPARMSVGILVCLVTGYVLQLASVTGAEAVISAILTAAVVIYTVAGMASMSRRFKASGHSMVSRVLLIGTGILLVQPFVMIVGICSALFGRQGMISGYIKKKTDKQNEEDDDK